MAGADTATEVCPWPCDEDASSARGLCVDDPSSRYRETSSDRGMLGEGSGVYWTELAGVKALSVTPVSLNVGDQNETAMSPGEAIDEVCLWEADWGTGTVNERGRACATANDSSRARARSSSSCSRVLCRSSDSRADSASMRFKVSSCSVSEGRRMGDEDTWTAALEDAVATIGRFEGGSPGGGAHNDGV